MIALIKSDLSKLHVHEWTICEQWNVRPTKQCIKDYLGTGLSIYAKPMSFVGMWNVFTKPDNSVELFETIEQLFAKYPDIMVDCI